MNLKVIQVHIRPPSCQNYSSTFVYGPILMKICLNATVFTYTLNNEGLYTVRNKACLGSFLKLSLRFWSLIKPLSESSLFRTEEGLLYKAL